MGLRQQRPVYVMTVWFLLSLWLLFGGLELAEATQYIQENLSDDGGENEDLEALVQLAFAIKAELPTVIKAAPFSTVAIALSPSASGAQAVFMQHQLPSLTVHGPPRLSRHQQISVYRI